MPILRAFRKPAEAAWAGFLKARKMGIYKILEVLETGKMTESDSPLER